ncbi:hypothetical protein TNCT6_53130 [Streptomyces sp. 6-11-2]|nr:hypothetical protein TNCT6_53130 [Streptomyces sp. 6-11-2]
MPGCCCSNCLPSVVKLSFSEAAAKTVTVPDSFGAADADVPDPAEDEPSEDEEEQALRASNAAAPATPDFSILVRRVERVITVLLLWLCTEEAVAPCHDRSYGRAAIILPQLPGVRALLHCMSWRCVTQGSHVRLYEAVVRVRTLRRWCP